MCKFNLVLNTIFINIWSPARTGATRWRTRLRTWSRTASSNTRRTRPRTWAPCSTSRPRRASRRTERRTWSSWSSATACHPPTSRRGRKRRPTSSRSRRLGARMAKCVVITNRYTPVESTISAGLMVRFMGIWVLIGVSAFLFLYCYGFGCLSLEAVVTPLSC